MILFALVAALVAAAPAAAASAATLLAQSERSASASKGTAAALAQTVAPADLMIPLEMDVAKKAILAFPTLDADAKQLESQYPGIWSAVWIAIEPEVRRYVESDYPKFWSALEQLYLSRLSEAEAQALLAFYRTSTGQKLLRGLIQNLDAAPAVAEMVESRSGSVSAEQMTAITDRAKLRAVKEIGPEDESNLMTLVKTIDLVKFRSLGAETQKLTLDWVNAEDPEADAQIQSLMEAAMERYIAQTSANR